ncbi:MULTISPECIES: DUF294 nucleotidyltransferase-like domain-containing protein [Bacillaceae]|uniref:Cyclic nucleotide-binding domain-containing protein n=1 Tax=Evansella alkalicola TaxID=745819 RepID=A0ABS6JT42_9BACI|nr:MULTISPECIES: DUF294 nucleotidyltransferase-like domain-containing protein [Bacillaceae]MBU9721417.1 cyclic nucleotide-binding domain-containing protein [Bacillus alkalicola]
MSGMISSDYQLIRQTSPFHLLTDRDFKLITKSATRKVFQANEFLFHDNEEEVEIHFLLSGLAKNILHRENGEQYSVRFYYPGDLVGTLILLARGSMVFSVQALEQCETIKFCKDTFLKVMTENKQFSQVVLNEIGERMKSLYNEIKRGGSFEAENIPLYRMRVRSIMESVPAVQRERSIIECARTMAEIGSPGLVVWDQNKDFSGVLTTNQVIEALLKNRGNDKADQWIENKNPVVHEDAFCYEVLPFFQLEKVALIPVLNHDHVVGVLTAESFLQLQNSKFLNLTNKLQQATSMEVIAKFSPKENKSFIEFIESLLDEGAPAIEVCEIISNFNDHIHRKIIEFALQEMKQEGFGGPPVNFCFIVMGSQGRKEQTFSTDQDNGFILGSYEHLPNSSDVLNYFLVLGKRINEYLEESGFPKCTGGIMAGEKKWIRSIDSWEEEVKRWVKETDAQEVRDFTIFCDYRPIYGDFDLANTLRNRITSYIQKGKVLQFMLVKDTIRFRVPQLISIKGRKKHLDLKKSALMQIVNGVRIFAIKYGIQDVSTLKRLQTLEKMEVFHHRDARNAMFAFDFLSQIRIRKNLSQIRSHHQLSNEINLIDLPKDDRKKLKEALSVAKRIQQFCELSYARNRGI